MHFSIFIQLFSAIFHDIFFLILQLGIFGLNFLFHFSYITNWWKKFYSTPRFVR